MDLGWELKFQQDAISWKRDYEVEILKAFKELFYDNNQDTSKFNEEDVLFQLVNNMRIARNDPEYLDCYDGEVIERIIYGMRLFDKLN